MENLEVVKAIEKVWKQQAKDSRSSRMYFWLGIVLSFPIGVTAGIIGSYLYARLRG